MDKKTIKTLKVSLATTGGLLLLVSMLTLMGAKTVSVDKEQQDYEAAARQLAKEECDLTNAKFLVGYHEATDSIEAFKKFIVSQEEINEAIRLSEKAASCKDEAQEGLPSENQSQ